MISANQRTQGNKGRKAINLGDIVIQGPLRAHLKFLLSENADIKLFLKRKPEREVSPPLSGSVQLLL